MKDNKEKILKDTKEENVLPVYPAGEDIYNAGKELENTDLEDPLKTKTPGTADVSNAEKDFDEDVSGDDLDIPGAELDDADEAVGSEDEENNYYSIGGDDHNDLDEDSGK